MAGGASVGSGAWVGAGAVILEGRSVGPDCVVGAGAVVVDDIPPGTTVWNPRPPAPLNSQRYQGAECRHPSECTCLRLT